MFGTSDGEVTLEVAFTGPAPGRVVPGLYLSDPRGHALLVGFSPDYSSLRSLDVLDLGGVVQLAGIQVEDPEVLAALAARLDQLAAGLRKRRQGGAVSTVKCSTAGATKEG